MDTMISWKNVERFEDLRFEGFCFERKMKIDQARVERVEQKTQSELKWKDCRGKGDIMSIGFESRSVRIVSGRLWSKNKVVMRPFHVIVGLQQFSSMS